MSRGLFARGALILACAALLLFAATASTVAQEAFSVGGVAVDATAADAIQARNAALEQGQRAAWRMLVERLVAADRVEAAATLPDAQLAPLVQSFEVEEEKVAPDRYIAMLTYHFNEDAVRALLGSLSVPFVEASRTPLVVLPVLDTGSARLLFEDGNAWRAAWDGVAGEPGLVPLVVPFGDLEDVAAIDGTRAAGLDETAIGTMARRYQTSGVVIALAAPDPDAEVGSRGLSVAVTILQGARREQASRTVALPAEGDDAELYAAAARAVRAAIDAAWKEPNLMAGGVERTIAVQVPVAGLADWVDIRGRLAGVGAVRRVEVTVLGVGLVSATLTVVGDDPGLAGALATQRLALAREADISILRRTDGAALAP